MGWLSVIGGALLALVLWDVFHTLWYPSGQGRISHAVMGCVRRLTRRLGDRARQLSGPLAMVAVIGLWALLAVLGGALLYWPHLPTSFSYSGSLSPGAGTVVDALYVSLVTLATLGYGDIVPTAGWLRLVTPLQALVGFALLTAAVTWVLQVYPALLRRRAVALQLSALRESGALQTLGELSPTTAARLLENLADGVTQVRVDLTQYTETYYFQEEAAKATFALNVGYAHDLARAGAGSRDVDVRFAAAVLAHSLEDLAEVLARQFLGDRADTAAVLTAYAQAQGPPR